MGQHSRRERFVWWRTGLEHRLFFLEIANSDRGNLNWRLRKAGHSQDRARRRVLTKVISEDFVQLSVALCIFQVDVNVTQMIHRQTECANCVPDVFERLAN